MKESELDLVIGVVVVCLVLLSYSVLNAQSVTGANESGGSNASIELMMPDFDNEMGISGYAIFVKSEVEIKKESYFVCDIPVAHGERAVSYWGDESQTTIGNPYAGFRLGREELPVTFDIGIRVPFSSENNSLARSAGGFSDIEHLDAFTLDYFTFRTAISYRSNSTDNLNGEINLGPTIWLYTGDSRYADDTEVTIGYRLRTFYSRRSFDVGAGLSGLVCLTEDEFLGDDRSVNVLTFESSVAAGNARPGIEVSLPIDDDLDDVLDTVIGLNLKYYF